MVITALFYVFFIDVAIGIPVSNRSSETCSNKMLVAEIKNEFEKSTPGLKYLGDLPVYAATSCHQIHDLRPKSKSGHYWIQGSSGPSRVYCQMEGGGCGEGVWMRVANVNMTVASASCPLGLEKILSPRHLCRKGVDLGCSSVKFSTLGLPFTNVCGQVIGYQHYSPDAFYSYHAHQTRTIDDLYVDGVSITHSSNPRQHIWTFASALHEAPSETWYSCPCSYTKSRVPFVGSIPEFVRQDYFCETGSRTMYSNRYYLEDPLWDGEGCGRFSTCCDGDNKPWFRKMLNEKITSDLEFRLCCDSARSDEDILIEIIFLFVQ